MGFEQYYTELKKEAETQNIEKKVDSSEIITETLENRNIEPNIEYNIHIADMTRDIESVTKQEILEDSEIENWKRRFKNAINTDEALEIKTLFRDEIKSRGGILEETMSEKMAKKELEVCSGTLINQKGIKSGGEYEYHIGNAADIINLAIEQGFLNKSERTTWINDFKLCPNAGEVRRIILELKNLLEIKGADIESYPKYTKPSMEEEAVDEQEALSEIRENIEEDL